VMKDKSIQDVIGGDGANKRGPGKGREEQVLDRDRMHGELHSG